MAIVKVKFRPDADGTGGTVCYQIIHNRKSKTVASGYRLHADEWDSKRMMPFVAPDGVSSASLLEIHDNIRRDQARMARVIKKLEDRGLDYSADDVAEAYSLYRRRYTSCRFMKSIISDLKGGMHIRTAETYRSALSGFMSFRGGADIHLDEITPSLIGRYEHWMSGRGLTPNTTSFYMRILRAAYNRAVDAGIIESLHPFRHVYTGIGRTVKRALPLALIRRIRNLNLTDNPKLDYARDMFMMSFYLRGMSFIDMAFLRTSDLSNGYVSYRRRKTGQRLTIKWTSEMQAIVSKYPSAAADFLLPIISDTALNMRSAYRNKNYNINHNLKAVGVLAGITVPLTLYVARHSWASAARTKGVPVSVISEGMGHESESTTRIYLASLDTSAVDRANSLIISAL